MKKRSLITIFARCFRGIAKLGVTIGDKFFVDLLNRESDKLLTRYIIFLKHEGIVGGDNRVAQYEAGKNLTVQIKNLLNLTEILKHLDLIGSATPLLFERDLLKLWLTILNYTASLVTGKIKKGDKSAVAGAAAPPPARFTRQKSTAFGPIHREILDFIKSSALSSFTTGLGEQVQNTEVFTRFGNITRRTLKRKLSELIRAGAIKRLVQGKKVFYVVSGRDQI